MVSGIVLQFRWTYDNICAENQKLERIAVAELKKNELYTVTIEGYSSEGMGIARIDGQVVFIKGAISGETCKIKLLKVLKNCAYAKIEKIVEVSPHRVEPTCPVFGKCGGCDFMHMDYEEELRYKLQRVQDALTRLGGTDLQVEEILGAEEQKHYRNKAIFAVGAQKGLPAIGFYRGRSHDIVPADACGIQAEMSARAAGTVYRWMHLYKVSSYDETTGKGLIRHVFCRVGKQSGEGQVTIVATQKKLPHTDALIQEIQHACPEAVSIVLNYNPTKGNTVLAGTCITLWGSDTITDVLLGLRFKLSPLSFYQVNHDQAERLYEKALEFAGLTGGETVIDLYCGTGTITLCLAKQAGHVIGAEIAPAAVEDARENAENNGIQNAEFILADAGQAAKELKNRGICPDVVVVDPPRKGLSEDVPVTISEMDPARVVYVSCDPATLGRDIKRFAEVGYSVQRAAAVDMFPRCAHVETVVLLSRKNA